MSHQNNKFIFTTEPVDKQAIKESTKGQLYASICPTYYDGHKSLHFFQTEIAEKRNIINKLLVSSAPIDLRIAL